MLNDSQEIKVTRLLLNSLIQTRLDLYVICIYHTRMSLDAKATNPSSEKEFLETYDANAYPHPSLSVDVVVLSCHEGKLYTVLKKREKHPFMHHWGLVGSFMAMDEHLSNTANRALNNKLGITNLYLEQLYTFSNPERDPRTRVVSVVYFGLIPFEDIRNFALPENTCLAEIEVPWEGETGGSVIARKVNLNNRDASAVNASVDSELLLAFDHADILGLTVKRLRGKLNYTEIAYKLLPTYFRLRNLQDVHEAILGKTVNKDSFRRRMLASKQLRATGKQEKSVTHRPAELYEYVGKSEEAGGIL